MAWCGRCSPLANLDSWLPSYPVTILLIVRSKREGILFCVHFEIERYAQVERAAAGPTFGKWLPIASLLLWETRHNAA
jgi:hypothetical protein